MLPPGTKHIQSKFEIALLRRLMGDSALHVQYGIQAFAKFKRPECTRLHLREFQSQKISR